jgi:peptide/nickel transport system permease protein
MATWIPGSPTAEETATLPAPAPVAPRPLGAALALMRREPGGVVAVAILALFGLVALVPEAIAPYDPAAYHQSPEGRLLALSPPTRQHWLGTTYYGQDVLSQLVVGTRVPLIVGVCSAFFIVFIGTNIGLLAGYFGRRTDEALMRLTDVAFSLPFLPFAIVLAALFRPSLWNIIFAISIIQWRTCARVIRAQVLSLRERPFVLAVRAAGAGHFWILYRHILPNVLPLSLLYGALGIAWSVLAEAGLSFLGFGDPQRISWGQMIHFSFVTATIRNAWWWVIPPGICLMLLVFACFFMGRVFEEIVFPRLREE